MGWKVSPIGWLCLVIFILVALGSALTVAGPGLTWDEPAYRASEVRLQEWWREILSAPSASERSKLFTSDAIDFYFEFNRFGPNFHPPLASYAHLLSWMTLFPWVDDLSARRIASSIELGLACAVLAGFMARHYCKTVGAFAGFGLASMPRVFGDSHIAGTDIPVLCFWTLSALAFPAALASRHSQFLLSALLSLLFLVKFSGLMIALPLGVAFFAYAITGDRRPHLFRWIGWSMVIFLPLVPIAYALVAHPKSAEGDRDMIVDWVLAYSRLWGLAFLWPIVMLFIRQYGWRTRSMPIGMELPWRVLAYSPWVAVLLNPSWWHDPVRALAAFFDLSIRRQGYLPDIEIFYLGQQYVYSLPWHNAWVLMAVTIPLGLFILGMVGTAWTLLSRQPIAVYLLLHALTLPVIRMFPVPAHDGVRLFLPTFVFWSALAAIGANVLSHRLIERGINHRLVWISLFAMGPIWGLVEIGRWHPVELSYYNIGLPRARDLGFEVTYWYDAVNQPVLDDLNDRLPRQAHLALPSPRINPEVFLENQSHGNLRADLRFDLSEADDFPYMLLLTHASKSDPFTRLLYGVRPWYSSSKDGVRLFSVIDPRGVALAWSLYVLAVDRETRRFSFKGTESIRNAVSLIAEHGLEALSHAKGASLETRAILQDWLPGGRVHPDLDRLLIQHRAELDEAIELLETRAADVQSLIDHAGYPADVSWVPGDSSSFRIE
jgi:hypothetical protein